jgi:hypothetical protein
MAEKRKPGRPLKYLLVSYTESEFSSPQGLGPWNLDDDDDTKTIQNMHVTI